MRIGSFLSAFLAICTAAPAQAADYVVFYLGGQSNMDGFGYVRELPDELKQPQNGVMIFHGNMQADKQAVSGQGLWSVLQPGHGTGFQSDGKANKYGDRFGVELSFAAEMQKRLPGKKIALIKYSRGGTSIDAAAAGGFGCWEPDFNQGEGVGRGINQYDHFLATLKYAFADRDIDADGQDDTLTPAGILWMQGESDGANTPEVAARYEANLKRLMDLLRAALRSDDLPVVIGRISDSGKGPSGGKVWFHGETIRAAQAAYCEHDGHAALVTTTDAYGYSDPWHYNSAGYIDLGKQFAIEMTKLLERK